MIEVIKITKKRKQNPARKRIRKRVANSHADRRLKTGTPPWFIDESMPCPCGSGLSYLNCCKKFISKYGDADSELYNENDFNEAVKIWRGKLTKYLGFVFRDTLPMLKRFPEKQIEDFILIDIDAIDELVSGLVFYLGKQNKHEEVLGLFDHLTDTIPLPNLGERMLSWKAVCYDCMLGETDKARKLLKNIKVEKVSYAPLLQIYFQLFGFELSVTRRFEILDQIIMCTKERPQILQYSTLKAINFIMVGDSEKAEKVIEKAIQTYEPLSKDKSDVYYINMFARALVVKWKLSGEKVDLDKALEYYRTIPEDNLTKEGKAGVHEEQATLYKDAAIYEKAIYHYKKTLEAVVSESAIIHLAEVYIKCDQIEKGRSLLAGLKEDLISKTCMLDYLQVKGLFGLAVKNEDLVHQVVGKIKTLKFTDLYYQDACKQLRLELLEMLSNINQKSQVIGFSRKLMMLFGKLQLACEYIELKPNIFGFGINLNKIIGKPKSRQNLSVKDRAENLMNE